MIKISSTNGRDLLIRLNKVIGEERFIVDKCRYSRNRYKLVTNTGKSKFTVFLKEASEFIKENAPELVFKNENYMHNFFYKGMMKIIIIDEVLQKETCFDETNTEILSATEHEGMDLLSDDDIDGYYDHPQDIDLAKTEEPLVMTKDEEKENGKKKRTTRKK